MPCCRVTESPSADAADILRTAPTRIRQYRTANATLRFVDRSGAALPGLDAHVRLVRHAFRLGFSAFRPAALTAPGFAPLYDDRVVELFNYATLPVYWAFYEPEEGQPREERLEAMADWCLARGITPKGHTLMWHQHLPAWTNGLDDRAVIERLEARIRDIVARFRGKIDVWDVANEATASHHHDNAVGRWVKRHGAAACVAKAIAWAQEANPDALLVNNDDHIAPDLERLAAVLRESGAPLGALGFQSHMHTAHWPVERLWNICEIYGRFGFPLHFTEVTILSGPFFEGKDGSQSVSTPEWEARQVAYGQRFYTTLFSHPAVEAITWWDLGDGGTFRGAPGGLLREDGSAKPLYAWLRRAFGKCWTTDRWVTADADGRARFRCYFGDYEVTSALPSGASLRGRFTLDRDGDWGITVTLSPTRTPNIHRPGTCCRAND